MTFLKDFLSAVFFAIFELCNFFEAKELYWY